MENHAGMGFDPTEDKLSEKQLKWGYWWVTHKAQVRRWFSVFLGIVAAILVGYAGFGFLDWFFGSGVQERAGIGLLTRQWTDFGYFREVARPQELSVGGTSILSAGDKRYDVVSQISNPNEIWWVEFDYQATGGGLSAPVKRGYLLPSDTRYIRELGMESESRPGVSFEVSNLHWHRVDAHYVFPGYPSWSNDRLNFRILDAEFIPPEPTDPLPVGKARFTVENDTAFGYFSVGFFIKLYSGSKIVGVNQVVISNLRAGERREVEVSWFNDLPKVTQVEVRPEVNIFDEEVYIPPGR
jgi:hypothetical protein